LEIDASSPIGPQLQYSIDGSLTYQSDNVFSKFSADDLLIVVAHGNACSEVLSAQLVNASNMNRGLYFIQIHTGKAQPINKLIIE